MSLPEVIRDCQQPDLDKRYYQTLASFKAEVLALEEGMENLSAGLLFHKHGIIRGLYVVELWELVVRRGTKNLGTTFMTGLCQLADKYGITLVLSLARKGAYGGPLWKTTTSRERLMKFYRRFGFVRTAIEELDTELPATMHRKPHHGTPNDRH